MHPTPGPCADSDANVAKDAATVSFLEYCRNGERAALEAALLACAPAVRRIAGRLVRRSEIDDLAHDCFVVAIRRARRFDGRGSLLPWLLGILNNLARSRHRLRWKRLRSEDVADGEEKLAEHATDESSVLERAEWMQLVDRELENLAEPYRTVVRAHLVAGEPLAAIAAQRGQPPTTVRSQFTRGLHELKRRLPAPMLAGLAGILATREATAAPGGIWTTRRSFVSAAAAMLVVAAWLVWNAGGAAASLPLPARAAPIVAQSGTGPNAPFDAAAQRDASPRSEAPAVHARLLQLDGKPATGVPVVFDPHFVLGQSTTRSSAHWRVALTDAEGVAHFAITAAGRAALRLDDVQVLHDFDVADRSMRFAFTLDRVDEVAISLIDTEDRPVAGGRIFYRTPLSSAAPGLMAAITDSNGSARFGVPRTTFELPALSGRNRAVRTRFPLASYRFWVITKDYLTLPFGTTNPEGSTRDQPVVLQLVRSALRHCGTVRNTRGEPLADAWVAVWSEDNNLIPPCYAYTDEHGRFEIGGFGAGNWAAAAFAPGFAAAQSPRLADGDEANLQLTLGGSVSGRVALSGLGDVSAWSVRSMLQDGLLRDPLDVSVSVVGVDGTFHLEHVAAGKREVVLFRQRSQPPDVHSVLVVEGSDTRIDFDPAAAVPWVVRVEDEQHQPLVKHLVRVTNPSEDPDYYDEAVTDVQGRAHLKAPDPAPKRVWVHAPWALLHDGLPMWVAEAVLPSATTVVVIPARRPCRLSGALPVEKLRWGRSLLRLTRFGGARSIVVNENGSFAAEGLPPGDYTLQMARQSENQYWAVTLADVSLREGEDEQLGPIDVRPLVDVDLTWAPGGARADLSVALCDAAGHFVENLVLGPGQVRRRSLPAGEYVASYADAAGAPAAHRFVLDPTPDVARIELPRTAGHPCHLEIRAEWNVPFFVLRGSLRRVGATVASDHWLRRGRDAPTWSVDLDLEPGVYEFSTRVGAPPEARGRFTVSASDELAVHPFVLK